MNSRASIELCWIKAQEKVRERNKEKLRMILLERDSLIAIGCEVPESMINEIRGLHDEVFCMKEEPMMPKPQGPLNEVFREGGRGPIADFLFRVFA